MYTFQHYFKNFPLFFGITMQAIFSDVEIRLVDNSLVGRSYLYLLITFSWVVPLHLAYMRFLHHMRLELSNVTSI